MKAIYNFKKTHIRIVVILLFAAFSGCERDDFQKLPERNWQLVWSDEFEGDAGQLPDPTKWAFDIGTGEDGWGNLELQSYTNNPANVSLDGQGNLVITARQSGNSFTSGRIKTQGLFSQQYGRFEARLKTPYGPGIWPAFWMLGDNIETVGWPQSGEIDIMELRGQEPHTIHGSIHGPAIRVETPFPKTIPLSMTGLTTIITFLPLNGMQTRSTFS
jgi:beta-glucanase (GH16 family)